MENIQNTQSGKTYRELFQAIKGETSTPSSKRSAPSVTIPYQFLNLTTRSEQLVWNKAGEIVGDNYSIAWRTLDAQYWGVPQRRKRIYIVADFTGRRAGEILFKPDSVRGDMSQSNEAWQKVAADAVGCVDGCSGNGGQLAATVISSYGTKWNGNAGAYNGENFVLQKPGIDGSVGAAGVVSKGNGDCFIIPEKHMSLSVGGGQAGQGYPCAVYSFDSLSSNSHQHEPVIAFAQNQREEVRDLGGKAGALAAEAGVHQQTYVAQPVIALQANGIDRADTAGCNGCGWRYNESYTLNTIDRHAVCYDARGNGEGATACTITGDHQNRITDYTAVAVCKTNPPRKYIIRRLTPTECARLQGFPDWWGELAPYDPADAEFWEQVRKTHAEITGKTYKPAKNLKKWYDSLHTDSAEYKMWGNGIALPCAQYVLQGIAEQGAQTLGSLFDGSGGFPLAGVLNGIKPIWASEVEPYCIAVTKSRFKEKHNGK